GRKRRNKKRERGQQRCFQKNDGDAGEDVDLHSARVNCLQGVVQLFVRSAAHLAHRFVQHGLFPRVENRDEQRAHQRDADREKKEHAEEFTKQIFKTRLRLRQNRVNGPVFNVLRNQARRRDDREQRTENRHRTKRNVFQNLKLLLKAEPCHEHGTANQDEREKQKNVKNFLTRELGQRVGGDCEDSRRRKPA